MQNPNRTLKKSYSQPSTIEVCDDEEYEVSSQLSRKSYVGEYGKDFVLDRQINEERARNVRIYAARLESGKDLYTGELLSLPDFLCSKGLGNLPHSQAILRLSIEERIRYGLEKHELDHD